MTKAKRKELYLKLVADLRRWAAMSDAELLAEVQRTFSVIKSATRDECYHTLVTGSVEKMID